MTLPPSQQSTTWCRRQCWKQNPFETSAISALRAADFYADGVFAGIERFLRYVISPCEYRNNENARKLLPSRQHASDHLYYSFSRMRKVPNVSAKMRAFFFGWGSFSSHNSVHAPRTGRSQGVNRVRLCHLSACDTSRRRELTVTSRPAGTQRGPPDRFPLKFGSNCAPKRRISRGNWSRLRSAFCQNSLRRQIAAGARNQYHRTGRTISRFPALGRQSRR